jgi:hypothetical protein
MELPTSKKGKISFHAPKIEMRADMKKEKN